MVNDSIAMLFGNGAPAVPPPPPNPCLNARPGLLVSYTETAPAFVPVTNGQVFAITRTNLPSSMDPLYLFVFRLANDPPNTPCCNAQAMGIAAASVPTGFYVSLAPGANPFSAPPNNELGVQINYSGGQANTTHRLTFWYTGCNDDVLEFHVDITLTP